MNKTLSHVAAEWSLTRAKKQRKSPVKYMIPKVVAVAYGIGRLTRAFHYKV